MSAVTLKGFRHKKAQEPQNLSASFIIQLTVQIIFHLQFSIFDLPLRRIASETNDKFQIENQKWKMTVSYFQGRMKLANLSFFLWFLCFFVAKTLLSQRGYSI